MLLAAGIAFEATAQSRFTVKKGALTATVKGTVAQFGTKDYVFSYEAGHIARMQITSENGCVKFGGGETEMNLATQAGDNYIDLRNQCGSEKSFSILIHFE